MTDAEVTHAWALWTASSIRDALLEAGVTDVNEDGWDDIVAGVLEDIALSNLTRPKESEVK